MSDTYFIKKLNCAYCGKENDFRKDDEYGRSLVFKTELGADFICQKCGKKNLITFSIYAIKSKPKRKKRRIKMNKIKKLK